MTTQHTKSPCCKSFIRRFGKRRRQCATCKKTWSIRQKKRGRPRVRVSSAKEILRQIFLERFTLGHLIRRRPHLSLFGFRHRFRQLLRQFVTSSSSQERRIIPSGPLILLADGLWFNFKNKNWVLYLSALRSIYGTKAIFLDPMLFAEREGAYTWEKVFASIPEEARTRICALVADNLQGMKLIAKRHGWLLQLCHFHLILKLQLRRGGKRKRKQKALRGGKTREKIYKLIYRAIELPEGPSLTRTINQLKQLVQSDCGTQRIQAVIRDFLYSLSFYRTYLSHPELHLPTTTNAVESMGRVVRELLLRNRCASSPQSLQLWTTALIRMRSEINCNGKIINRIY